MHDSPIMEILFISPFPRYIYLFKLASKLDELCASDVLLSAYERHEIRERNKFHFGYVTISGLHCGSFLPPKM